MRTAEEQQKEEEQDEDGGQDQDQSKNMHEPRTGYVVQRPQTPGSTQLRKQTQVPRAGDENIPVCIHAYIPAGATEVHSPTTKQDSQIQRIIHP
jgi:hypothetical protein